MCLCGVQLHKHEASQQSVCFHHVSTSCLCLHAQIIALANLRLKATHSAQTLSSGFRAEGSSQTWLPKDAAVQTKVRLIEGVGLISGR